MGRNNLKVSVESVVKKEEIVKDVGEEWRRGGVVKKLKVKILGRVRYSGGKSYWLTKYKLLKRIRRVGRDRHGGAVEVGRPDGEVVVGLDAGEYAPVKAAPAVVVVVAAGFGHAEMILSGFSQLDYI
ncbi:uncharacterized protein G2W53_021347 [Senna tora]|uniref:Uncharacterized protein n=1 Tax=Senna tora TaxID=362788 RepID=A0A834WJI1_9FABA|nr:uncharacterized protein G2W53_021347 [Senna tora]